MSIAVSTIMGTTHFFLLLVLTTGCAAKRRQHDTRRSEDQEGMFRWHSNSPSSNTDFYDNFYESNQPEFFWEHDQEFPSPKQQQSTKYTVKTKVSLTESEVEEQETKTPTSQSLKEKTIEHYAEYDPSEYKQYQVNSFRQSKETKPLSTTSKPTTTTNTTTRKSATTTSALVGKPSALIKRLPLVQISKDLGYLSTNSRPHYSPQMSSQVTNHRPLFASHLPKTEYQISIVHAPDNRGHFYTNTRLPILTTTIIPIIATNTSATTQTTTKTSAATPKTTKLKRIKQTTSKRKEENSTWKNADVDDIDLRPLSAPKGNFGVRIKAKKISKT